MSEVINWNYLCDRDIIEIIITYSGVNMKIINLMIVTLMVLIVAIGSVCAGTDGSLLSDDEDFDDEYGDDFELCVGAHDREGEACIPCSHRASERVPLERRHLRVNYTEPRRL